MPRFLCYICIILIGVLLVGCGTASDGTVFYVSPSGNDNNPGTKTKPFASVTKAQDTVRKLKSTHAFSDPVTVYLRGGRYELSEPIVFGPEDSGTKTAPISFLAYPGEIPIVSGGRAVTGWKPADNGRWVTHLPRIESGAWYFKQLYVNGEIRPRTRLPKEGYYRIVDFPNKDSDPWAAPSDHFTFTPGDIHKDWRNISDIEVAVLRFWVSSRQHIAEVNETTNTVRFAETSRYRYSDDFTAAGARYYIENVYEALDQPGEWYLDRSTGTLTYYPKSGEDMNTVEIIAPISAYLIRFEGDPGKQMWVSNMTFSGITFTRNNWMLPAGNAGDGQSAPSVEGAVYLKGTIDCAFTDCRFVQLSSYAVQIDAGCRNNRFAGNELGHLGGGGFRIGGGHAKSHPDLRTEKNIISDNHIHHIGEIHHAATGVWIQHSGGNTITHNEIDHTYYSSIAIGWVWGYRPSVSSHNEVSFNHIHHVGQGVLSDMGAIYLLGVAPGTIVRNNLIHDIQSHGYGGWGIYTDEGSTHVLVENNIVYNTKCAGFDQHYGRENFIRNNIFALGHEEQINRSRIEEHISFFMERNIVYWKEDIPVLSGRWHDVAYMHRPGKPWFDAEPDSLTEVFDYNLYFNPNKARDEITFGDWTFGQWLARGQDAHSLYADPGFADPEKGDFTLSDNSPAFTLGFRPIDMSTVGPRR